MSLISRNINEYYEIACFGDFDAVCSCFMSMHSKKLKRRAYIDGKVLYSDMTLDEMYMTVVGMTVDQYNAVRLKCESNIKLDRRQAVRDVSASAAYYMTLGAELFSDSKQELWHRMVNASVSNGVYREYELQCVIDIVRLKDNWTTAREVFQNQNHSSCSASLVITMLRDLLRDDYSDADAFAYYLYN